MGCQSWVQLLGIEADRMKQQRANRGSQHSRKSWPANGTSQDWGLSHKGKPQSGVLWLPFNNPNFHTPCLTLAAKSKKQTPSKQAGQDAALAGDPEEAVSPKPGQQTVEHGWYFWVAGKGRLAIHMLPVKMGLLVCLFTWSFTITNAKGGRQCLAERHTLAD